MVLDPDRGAFDIGDRDLMTFIDAALVVLVFDLGEEGSGFEFVPQLGRCLFGFADAVGEVVGGRFFGFVG